MMEREFKDSGTQGIGLIPQSWDSKQLGVFFSENRKANTGLESVTALQFKYGEIIQKPNNGRDLSDKDKELLSKYTVIEPGDVIVNGLNLNFDLKSLRIAIAREHGIITSAYISLRPRKYVNSEFYNYVLKALDFQKILHGMGEGIRLTLSYDELKKLNVPSPDASIQSAIVSYLDEKCGEIDSLIALQEQMIESLKAYKQSVITEAVTKGLDPNAKLVPSGIDWIGDIPEGWEVCRIKDLVTMKSGFNLTSEDISNEGNYPVFGGNGLRGYYDKYSNEGDYVLVGRQGALCGNINYASGRFWATDHAVVCYPKRGFAITWFGETLRSMNLGQYSLSAAQPGLSVDRIKEKQIPLPPLSEQQAIASYLGEKCADIDRLIALKQQKIESLKDYKKSVIYEAVTGKTIIES